MSDISERRARLASLEAAENAGQVADSHDARLALMRRVKSGEITLVQAQAELKKLKRTARANGQVTQSQAYRGKRP